MRAITVRQPWAWQIIHQRKDVENRTRNIAGAYRGPVAIHAGLQADEDALRRLPIHAPEWVTAPRVFDYGVILGVVDLVDVHEAHPAEHAFGDTWAAACCESEWGQPEGHHLVLAHPRALPKPIPYRGALGLWTLPDGVLNQLEAVS